MSRKSGPPPSIVGEYGIELMNKEELRLYVQSLKEEHERARQIRSRWQKEQRELLHFLKSAKGRISTTAEVLMQKELEISNSIIEGENKRQVEEEVNKFVALEYREKEAQDIADAFPALRMVYDSNTDVENSLSKDVEEREKEAFFIRFAHKGILIDMIENCLRNLSDTSQMSEKTIRSVAQEYFRALNENIRRFSEDKTRVMTHIFGHSSFEMAEFKKTLDRMEDYFLDIFLKNIKTIEELNSKLSVLRKESNAVKLKSIDAIKENSKRKVPSILLSPPPSATFKGHYGVSNKDSSRQKSLDEVEYESYLLSLKLKALRNEHGDLKTDFISALRRIRQKAALKVLLLEQAITSINNVSNRSNSGQ